MAGASRSDGGRRPLVYAHRGGSGLRPENTLIAFDHGLALGADGLELDVQLSRDGVVVVHHDATLERTTNGRGAVAAVSAAELAALDAAWWFRPASDVADGTVDGSQAIYPLRGQGVTLPTLTAVLHRYPATPMIVELKLDESELARRVVHDIRSAGALDRVALGSFGGRVLREVRRLAPELRTGAGREETRWALYQSWVRWPWRRLAFQEFQVPETSGRTRVVSPRFVRLAHAAGAAVKVWTVDQEADMHRLLDWGVDALITDRPDRAVPLVRARS